jgi:hypothetical protein
MSELDVSEISFGDYWLVYASTVGFGRSIYEKDVFFPIFVLYYCIHALL